MKKQLAILLAFMMIMSSMCGLTVFAGEPAPDAPIIHMVTGKTFGNNANNMAAGQILYTELTENYAGMFPLTLTVENTDGVGSNTIYIKYDKTKVRPVVAELNALGRFNAWKYGITTDRDHVFMKSEWSGDSILGSGMDTEVGYVYGGWSKTGGLSSEEWNAEGIAAEAGTFVFETLQGVTVADFDEETFQVANISDITENVIYSQTSARTTLSAVANGSKLYGYSDSTTERLPMLVNFTYPNSDKEVSGNTPVIPPVPTKYTVTFHVDGVITTVEIEEGQVVTLPADPVKAGYTFDGWFVNDVAIDETYTVDSDVTIVAKFTVIPPTMYTVTFVTESGTVKVVTVEAGETIPANEIPGDAVKDGWFEFVGWFVDNVEVNESYAVNGNVIAEAVFEEIETFTVTFTADGVVIDTIVKAVGDVATEADFPEVPGKEGYEGAWDVAGDIAVTTNVNAVYSPIFIPVEGVNIETIGLTIGEFDEGVTNYDANIEADFTGNYYVIKAVVEDGMTVEYFVDDVKAEYTVNGALYFDMMTGTTSEIVVAVTDAGNTTTRYIINVRQLSATNDFFLTSGIDIDFDPTVNEYTAIVDADEEYARLWTPAYSGRDIEYAIGDADDVAENATFAKLAVGCDNRENEHFADTENFDANWATKSFVNLWTEDLETSNKMFIKITEGSEVNYYTITLN